MIITSYFSVWILGRVIIIYMRSIVIVFDAIITVFRQLFLLEFIRCILIRVTYRELRTEPFSE